MHTKISPIPLLDTTNLVEWAPALKQSYHRNYYAMYSSVFGGITTEPLLMVVPVDDHMVHRGDGIFETLKCVNGNLYNLEAHLRRLESSAKAIALEPRWSRKEIADILVQTTRRGGRKDCLVRLLLSRGPGSLGISPYDCPKPALYVMVSELHPPFMKQHPDGARVIFCPVPVKPAFFANIKSVNYLPNVLMKKAAVDAGVDFALSFDENGNLAEGATENAGIVTADRALRVPKQDRILGGTTMLRALDLAQGLVRSGELSKTEFADIPKKDLEAAPEILIFGTTPDVTAVIEMDGRPVGRGRPGPVYQALSKLLVSDIYENKALQTPVFS